MDTGVYINGREACSKANDGSSKVAFPDPCWSPPPPPAGPIIIPYPNTTYSRDLKKGTRTVFIRNRPVAKQDISYFSTSTGNEPATQAFSKGLITGVIKGKAYFVSWSPNVKFEGKCVARHNDYMTHNHGSQTGNTPLFPFISRTGRDKNACNKEKEKIEKACNYPYTSKDENKKYKGKKGKMLHQIDKAMGKDKTPPKGVNKENWDWRESYCGSLKNSLFYKEPAHEKMEEIIEKIDKFDETLQKYTKDFKKLESVADKLNANSVTGFVVDGAKTAAYDYVDDIVENIATKGVTKVGARGIPGLGWVLMAYDVVVEGGAMKVIYDELQNTVMDQLDVLKDKIKDLEALEKRLEEFRKASPAQKREMALKLYFDLQDLFATLSPCLRSRKCQLVSFKDSKKMCCKGQTGHHLIPDTMMYKGVGKAKEGPVCSNYDHDKAPTMCTEGGKESGSHGRMHNMTDKNVSVKVDEMNAKGKGTNAAGQYEVSMDEAIDLAVKTAKKTFPLSGCSEKCLKAQLKTYYKKQCKNAKPILKYKNGNSPSDVDGNSSDE